MTFTPNRKRILLADDDVDDRTLFFEAYAKRYDILLMPSVVNGSELISFLHKQRECDMPDLIILDQNMPVMNGKQTLAFLKSNKRYASIHVCICSTYTDHQLIDECLKLGAYKVASKPITDEEYQKMMNDFLGVFTECEQI